jgi:hypothetical protein
MHALMLCIDRYTVQGLADLIHQSAAEVRLWRTRRRRPRPIAQAAIFWLSAVRPAEVECLAPSVMALPPLKTDRELSQSVSQSSVMVVIDQ